MKNIIKQIYQILEKTPKIIIEIISTILLIIFGIIDFYFGSKVSFSLFYLIPIFLATWFISKNNGIIFSFISAIICLFLDFDEEYISHLTNFIFYWDAITRLAFFLIFVNILSFLKETLKNNEKMARYDFLTGIINTRHFYEVAQSEINRSIRYNSIFSFAYIDLDNFKFINDTFGHPVGDALLTVIADIIKDNLRKTDIIARLGGDEFAILLPQTNFEQSSMAITKLKKEITKEMEKNNWPITTSIGLVTFKKIPISADEMIKITDDVMYIAKKSGKNRIEKIIYNG